MATYNICHKDWVRLQVELVNKGYSYWNVIDQWQTTAYAPHANKFLRTPIYLILLKSYKKVVIIVWGKTAWEMDGVVDTKNTTDEVLQNLPYPPPCY